MSDQALNNIKFLDRNLPTFSEEEARQIAADLYGLSGEFKPLKSERDQNFSIHTERDGSYVLKLSNAAEDPGVIDFQTQALLYIERQDPSLPVPRVIPTRGGEPYTTFHDREGTPHIVRVLSYLPGVIWDDAEIPLAMWRDLGKLVGELDLALRGFFHPYARHELPWDIMRSHELRPHTIHISSPQDRRNAEEALDTMANKVMPRLQRMRHQVIHADIHTENILTNPDQPGSISGIMDFGDMVYGPVAAEIAIAADLDGVPAEEQVKTLCALVAGYDRVYPLEAEEVDLIYDILLARLAATVTIIAWRRVMTPEQPAYQHQTERSFAAVIANLMSVGRAQVRDELRRACRFPVYCPTGHEEALADDTEELLARRHRVLGKGLSLFYSQPIHVERGRGPWLYSAQGEAYLDAYNNVPVVGHSHPHVVKAISRQAAALNTNTRYLYRSILDYAERLVGLLPGGPWICAFYNSGSEANDIAWSIATHVTGRKGGLVMETAYHGITEAGAHLSPYDEDRPLAPHIQTLISPDPYRGPYRQGQPDLAARYAADVDRAVAAMAENGFKPAAFMVDTSFVSNGIPDVPQGYLQAAAAKVRAAGGLIIADEVQAGFGRSGIHMWGHQVHGIMPDMITMGKPIGNGFPMGVVITRPDIIDPFMEATGLFSTFGGNPVACAAGSAVLDVIEEEGLMANARESGDHLRLGLRELMGRYPIIGDVRGRGLLAGVELVRDRESQEPATKETKRLLDLMRDNGVLAGKEGAFANVIKIRPPLVFRRRHADILIKAMDRSLAAL